ncbi:MAG: GNAT family N-acetyltransferase [Pseudomonadota bacterium]|nr:GNAT family N-acetyltransferase [Pseudomonadota bacterium]
MPTLRKNTERQRYEILTDGGEVAGFADYHDQDGAVAMPHTVVEPAHEGQGLAGQLTRFALDDIRASGRKVVPQCSYVRAWISRHPDYADLLAAP